MAKHPLTDHEVSDLLASVWNQIARHKGKTIHGDTALRSSAVALMMISTGLTSIMDKIADQDRNSTS